MARKTTTSVEKIKDFTSLADHDASTVKEGDVTLLTFDCYTIRRIIHSGEPFYSVVDAVGALTESANARKASDYWAQTKKRMIEKEGAEQLLTNCQQLRLPSADGKGYRTDCASIETMFRIIQSNRRSDEAIHHHQGV